MHREFFKTISRKPEYIQKVCNVLNNAFQFACRRWTLCSQTKKDMVYIKRNFQIKFYKDSTGQFSYIAFQPYAREQS